MAAFDRCCHCLAGFDRAAAARGPEGIADVAEQVIDAVVNISTKQIGRSAAAARCRNCRRARRSRNSSRSSSRTGAGRAGRQWQNGQTPSPRRVNSLGSGFIIDTSGLVVTNNHVIADADEVNVILNDGTTLKAEVIGRDQKTDLALLKVKPNKPLKAVKFGDSDKLRLGEWVIAIGNPFSLGGTVTAGIVSARNRDIQSGPVRQLHSDRCCDQSRQFGRAAVQSERRSDRRQHGDHLAVRRLDRHRLCRAVEDRRAGGRSVARVQAKCVADGSACASSR